MERNRKRTMYIRRKTKGLEAGLTHRTAICLIGGNSPLRPSTIGPKHFNFIICSPLLDRYSFYAIPYMKSHQFYVLYIHISPSGCNIPSHLIFEWNFNEPCFVCLSVENWLASSAKVNWTNRSSCITYEFYAVLQNLAETNSSRFKASFR